MAFPPEPRPAGTPADAPPPLPPELAGTLAGLEGAGEAPPSRRVPRTRTTAIRFGVCAGAASLVLLIIFVAQNTGTVELSFLWLRGRISLAPAMLVAGLCGALIATAVSAARR